MTEDMVVELMSFLQTLRLLHILSVLFTVLRYMFFNEEDTVKIDISYKKKADGTNQHLLLLDEHLLNATYLAATFIMFYLALSLCYVAC